MKRIVRRSGRQPEPFCVGDRVQIPSGRFPLEGEVVEDRGPLGVGGRRLYRVRLFMETDEPMYMELPASEMIRVETGQDDASSQSG